MKGRSVRRPAIFEQRYQLKPGLKLPPDLVLERVTKIERLTFFPKLAKLGIVRIVEVREGRSVLERDLSGTFLLEIRHEDDRIDEAREQLSTWPKHAMTLPPDGQDIRNKAI